MRSSNKITENNIINSVAETDWGFGDADTKELTHEIHRYSGKYIPQIARKAIELISLPGETILDPYVGSGTTLLEANLSLRNSIGVDLNPLAVLITKVKTTPINDEDLKELKNHFTEIVYRISISRNGQASLLDDPKKLSLKSAEPNARLKDAWYTKWFNKPVLEELIILDG